MHHVDLVDRHAELVAYQLRQRGLMPLAVAVRAGIDRDAAGRMHLDVGDLVEPGARAERPTTADGAMPQASM